MKKVPLTLTEAIRAYDRDCSIPPTFDEDGVQVSSGHDGLGRELPDPVPMAPPVGFSSGPSLADFIKRTIQQEMSRNAVEAGFESFEEAEDFDVEDDPPDPRTPYEAVFDPRPSAQPDPTLKEAVAKAENGVAVPAGGDKPVAEKSTGDPPKAS